jgi:signal transduction histidine kinase
MTLRAQFFAAMLLVSGCVGVAVVSFSSFVTGATLHEHDAADASGPPELSAALRDEVASLQHALDGNGISTSVSIKLPDRVATNWNVAVVGRDGTIVASSRRYFVGLRVTRRYPMVVLQPAHQAFRKGNFRSEIAQHLLREAPLYDRRGHTSATAMFMPTVRGMRELSSSRMQSRLNRLFLMAGLVALLASAAASGFLASQLIRPLRSLTRAATRMSEGDLSSRVPVARSSQELRELAVAFNGMASRLERTERLRAEMASDIAHELRTPLNNLHGQLEAIEANLIAASPDRIRSLKEETARLSELVADLQQLTLADGAAQHVHMEPVSPSEFLHLLVPKYGGLAAQAGIELRIDCPQEVPLVYADVRSLRHIFVNLIGNAVRHAPEHGHVVVAARRTDSCVTFSVADDGAGIPAEHLADIFERLFRTDTARSRDDGGSGLGLAIVKKLVEAHHGSIVAENLEPTGARISFTIPLYVESAA